MLRGPAWLDGWYQCDAGWYHGIATLGYGYVPGQQSRSPSSRLPAAVRGLGGLLGDTGGGLADRGRRGGGAVILFGAWACAAAPSERRDRGRRAPALPVRFFLYGAMYTDSLFLLTAVGAFVLLERRKFWLAGLVGALATAGRPVGVAVAVGLVVRALELLAQDRAAPLPGRRRPARRWAPARAGPARPGWRDVVRGGPVRCAGARPACWCRGPGWSRGPSTSVSVRQPARVRRGRVGARLEPGRRSAHVVQGRLPRHASDGPWSIALLLTLQALACLAAWSCSCRACGAGSAGATSRTPSSCSRSRSSARRTSWGPAGTAGRLPGHGRRRGLAGDRERRWLAPVALAVCGVLLVVLATLFVDGGSRSHDRTAGTRTVRDALDLLPHVERGGLHPPGGPGRRRDLRAAGRRGRDRRLRGDRGRRRLDRRDRPIADEMAAADPRVRVVHHPVNRKLGGSIKSGFAAAKGELVLYTDADLPFEMVELVRAVRVLRTYEADIVSAYRLDRTGEGPRRAVYSWVYNGLIQRDVRHPAARHQLRLQAVPPPRARPRGARQRGFVHRRRAGHPGAALGFQIVQIGVDYFPRTRGVSTLSSLGVIRTMLREMTALRGPNWHVCHPAPRGRDGAGCSSSPPTTWGSPTACAAPSGGRTRTASSPRRRCSPWGGPSTARPRCSRDDPDARPRRAPGARRGGPAAADRRGRSPRWSTRAARSRCRTGPSWPVAGRPPRPGRRAARVRRAARAGAGLGAPGHAPRHPPAHAPVARGWRGSSSSWRSGTRSAVRAAAWSRRGGPVGAGVGVAGRRLARAMAEAGLARPVATPAWTSPARWGAVRGPGAAPPRRAEGAATLRSTRTPGVADDPDAGGSTGATAGRASSRCSPTRAPADSSSGTASGRRRSASSRRWGHDRRSDRG